METTAISKDKQIANKGKTKIALSSIADYFILVIIKLAFGLFTRSIGLLSDALH